jgi:hypothetical protein
MSEWQPMSTAPKDRRILLDVSYIYDGDTEPTECYVCGEYDPANPEFCWLTDDASMRHDAPIAWIDIPKTKLALHGGDAP